MQKWQDMASFNEQTYDDIETLLYSDNECYIESDEETIQTTMDELKCQKCDRIYKVQRYFKLHINTCTGKRVKLQVKKSTKKGKVYIICNLLELVVERVLASYKQSKHTFLFLWIEY